MRFIKFLVITILVIALLGYGIYYFGTKMASEKLMEVLTSELENSGEIETIKDTIENDPALQAYLNGTASVDESTLPFTTKEEATRVLVRKFGISGLKDMQSKIQDGHLTKEEILKEAEGKLTEDEILALKVIAYKELSTK